VKGKGGIDIKEKEERYEVSIKNATDGRERGSGRVSACRKTWGIMGRLGE
jgi:hypothetical protein